MSDGFTLEKFASHPFYQEVNRRLVTLTHLHPGLKVVDVGAGTGAVTRLLVEQIASSPDSEVIAIEPSETAIEVARRNLENLSGAVVGFIQGGAEKLSQLVKKPVDAVFFCNAIHLISEKERVLQEIKKTLREDGTFSFNTTFYAGAEPPESEQLYRRWMMKALRILKSEYGLSPEKTRSTARAQLTPGQYRELLAENGFEVKELEIVRVELPLSGFEAISEYSLWIEGVLPGVPLDVGRDSLVEAIRQAFSELHVKSSPRNWLLVVANRA